MRQSFGHSMVLFLSLGLGMGSLPVFAQPSSVTSPSKATDPFFLTRAKNLARQAAERQNGGLNFYRAEGAMYGPAVDAPHVQNSDGSVTFNFKGGPPGFVTPTVETIATVTSQGSVNLQYNGPLRSATLAKVKPTFPQAPRPTITPGNLPTSLEKPVLIPITPTTTAAPRPSLPQTPTAPTPNAPGLPVLQSTSPVIPSPSRRLPVPPPLPIPNTPPPIHASIPPRTLPKPTQKSGVFADLFLSRAKNLARQAAINANGGLAQYRPESSMFGPAAGTPHIKNQDGSVTFKFQGGVPGYVTPTLESVVTVTQNSTVTVTYNGPVRP